MNDLSAPRLDDLALFAAVVEAGGFTAAARASGTPQATVSRRIAALERDLGLVLLERTTRRVVPTEAGSRVYEHARLIREQAEAVSRAAAEFGREVAGKLDVTAPVVLGQARLVPIVARFLRDHPRVDLRLEWTTRRVDPVEEGIDVAIRLGSGDDGDLMRRRLGTTRARPFAPPSFAAALPTHPSELADGSIVGLGHASGTAEIVFSRAGDTVRVGVRRRLVANDVLPLVATAEACGHIALLPDFCAPDGWRPVLLDWDTPENEVYALWTRSRGALPKVRAFVDALRAGFAACP